MPPFQSGEAFPEFELNSTVHKKGNEIVERGRVDVQGNRKKKEKGKRKEKRDEYGIQHRKTAFAPRAWPKTDNSGTWPLPGPCPALPGLA